MKLFSRKEQIILNSEQQKDTMVEKLEKAQVKYILREKEADGYSGRPTFIIRLDADDIKKVV